MAAVLILIELFSIERCIDGRAGFDVDPHTGGEFNLTGSIFAGRDVNGASAGLGASVNRLLNGGTGVIILTAGGAVQSFTLKTGVG